MDQPTLRADVLGKLLLIQQVLDVLPDNGEIAAFLGRALGEIPGVLDMHLCVGGEVFPPSDEFSEACAKCEASWSDAGTGTECMVGNASTICVPLRTARRLHGVLILSLGDERAFAPYESFVQNIVNVVATTLETRQYLRQLDDARAGLENQVAERTANLRDSEERFRGLFENTPVPIWEEDFSKVWAHLERLPRDDIGDIDAYLREHPEIVHRCADLVTVIDVNEAAVRFHQAADKDELLAGLTRTFTPESFENFRQELVAMWSGGTRLQADAVVRTLAGEPRSVTISWAVAPGHERSFGQVIFAELDITERKRVEDALRRSEAGLEEAQRVAHVGSWEWVAETDTPTWSKELCDILEVDPGEPVPKVAEQNKLYTPDSMARMNAAIEAAMQTGASYEIELERVRRDGSRRWLLARGERWLDAMGHVVGLRGTALDITERKQAERNVALMSFALDNVREAAFLIGEDGRFHYVNEESCRVLGYSRDELLALGVADVDPDFPLGRWASHWRDLKANRSLAFEGRHKAKDGRIFPVEISANYFEFDSRGYNLALVRDITQRKMGQEALEKSEERLRLEVARMPIGYIVWDQDFRVVSWNPAAEKIFGFTFDEANGRHPYELIVPPEAQPQVDDVWSRLLAGDASAHSVNENRTKDGRTILCDWTNTPLKQPDGTILGVMAMVQDVTERRRAQEDLRRSEERYRSVVSAISEGIVLQDGDGAIQACNASAEAIIGLTQDQMMGLTSLDPGWRAIHEDGSPFPGETHPAMVTLSTGQPRANVIMGLHKPDGMLTWISINSQPLLRSGETKPYAVVTSFMDITERIAAEAERSRLLLAIEQIADSVMVTHLDWTIAYVNRSFARVYGYEPEEVVGRNAVILSSGRHDASFWEEIRDMIAAGRTWSGSIVNRRKDGTLVEVERVISAVRDPVGRLTSYVQADRDVTRERAMEEELATGLRIRAAVAESLIGLRPGQGVPEIAQAICDNVATVPRLDVAILMHFLAEDSAIVTAIHAPPELPLHAGQALPPGRSRYLYRRAKRGPWSGRWKARVEDGEYGRGLSASGLKAVAYGPILHEGVPVGLLSIGTMHEEFAQDIVTRAPALAEFSATSSALLSGPLDALRRSERERANLRQIIAAGAFGPVFQPIQDLASGEVVGYEALTRFADGCPPDQRFGSAWSAGLGVELELATMEKAVAAATGLPAGRWLAINMSPRLLQTPERVAEIMRRVDRPVVIEITEHEVIEDYAAIREAVHSFGLHARISVDDAGAGAANFAHIIELHPDFVKLDIGLVHGVNVDLGRQALVIAMDHFSRSAGCRLIAEGVETKAEAEILTQLGVHYGQGYWFGRPQSVDAFAPAPPESSG